MGNNGEEHKYSVKYRIEFGEWTREEIGLDGGCDQFLLVSIIGKLATPGSEVSIAFVSENGEGEELNGTQLFQIWSTLAGNLSERNDISPMAKAITTEAFLEVKKRIIGKG